MTEYIDREKVIELIDYHQEEYFEAETYFELLKEDFLQLPSADVQPVKWIPVSEQLPPLDEDVLVFAYGNMIRVWVLEKQYPYSADVYWECEDGYWEDVSAVTHWMPLPQKPKDGET